MLFPLFWLIVLVAAVAAVIKWLWPETGRYNSGQRALDTLSERYAKGEIEREEYLRRRQDILGA